MLANWTVAVKQKLSSKLGHWVETDTADVTLTKIDTSRVERVRVLAQQL